MRSGAKRFFIHLLPSSIPIWPFLIYSSILKYTKTKFGDKDKLKTNVSHQTVVFFLSAELMSPLHSNAPV